MKKLLFILFLVVSSIRIFGQDNHFSKIQFLMDYHYNFGIFEGGNWADINRGDFKMYGNSIHFTALYNINQKLALGAGLGLDLYENPGFKTFPIFISCHYAPLNKTSNFYSYSNLGYSFESSSFVPGLLFDLGVGYKRMLKKRIGFNFQLGYNIKQRKDRIEVSVTPDHYVNRNFDQYRHSLSIGIGIIF